MKFLVGERVTITAPNSLAQRREGVVLIYDKPLRKYKVRVARNWSIWFEEDDLKTAQPNLPREESMTDDQLCDKLRTEVSTCMEDEVYARLTAADRIQELSDKVTALQTCLDTERRAQVVWNDAFHQISAIAKSREPLEGRTFEEDR
jgi:hypothetical protein